MIIKLLCLCMSVEKKLGVLWQLVFETVETSHLFKRLGLQTHLSWFLVLQGTRASDQPTAQTQLLSPKQSNKGARPSVSHPDGAPVTVEGVSQDRSKLSLEQCFSIEMSQTPGVRTVYRCNLCTKSYRESRNVRDHVCVAHLGLKRHICKLCGTAFAWRPELAAHRQSCDPSK